jgi:predicted transposase YbfD/YdcC
MDAPAIFQVPPEGYSLKEAKVRLARPEERVRWDQTVDQHHYLGFKRFAGRGLRYIVEWRGQWLALAGWQSGAFKSRHRDRWVGWKRELRYRRLHLIGNNTRFVILSRPGVFPHLASWALAAMTRRLSQDWQAAYGHPLLIGESFVDPAHFQGTLYQAANWHYLGNTRGFARHNGRYTDPHGKPKRLYVCALRRDARRILSRRGELADCWQAQPQAPAGTDIDQLSLYEELEQLPDHRRGQGRKHSLATVLAVYLLAALSNMRGPVAAAEYARALDQEQLKALGAWRNRRTGRYEAPTKSTIHRVVMATDAEALEAMQQRYATARVPAPGAQQQRQALAADGKRIRGANRNGTMRYETATLVEHRTGVPVASLNFHDQNGELAAVGALLEVVPISGAVITLDALHTTRNTTVSIVEQHDADYLLTVKGNCSETFEALASMPWEDAAGRFSEDPQQGHGRIDRRHIEVLTTLDKTLNFAHVAQVFRVRRERTDLNTGVKSIEYAYGITSLAATCAPPQQLLAWNRGHWAIESKNHHRRDRTLCEDAGMARSGFSPANRATCNNIVLALILHHRRWDNAAQALRYFTLRRSEAFKALLAPG